MLFSVTKVKTLCTQTLPSRLTQPKKILFHATLKLNICLDVAYGVVEKRKSFASLQRIEDFLISEDLFSISEDHYPQDRETVLERKSGNLQNDFTSISESQVSDEDPPH